ncbi:MAG: TRAP transporter small permease [Rhodospirillales bacterium]
MTPLARLLAALRLAERSVLVAAMLAMAVLYGVNVAVRNLAPAWSAHVVWIEEATVLVLIWVVFLGLGIALERGRHIAMTALFGRLGPAAARGVGRLVDLTGAAFAGWLAVLGWRFTAFVADTGQISPTLGIPALWFYAVLPAGFGLLALRYVLSLAGVVDRFAAAARQEGR